MDAKVTRKNQTTLMLMSNTLQDGFVSFYCETNVFSPPPQKETCFKDPNEPMSDVFTNMIKVAFIIKRWRKEFNLLNQYYLIFQLASRKSAIKKNKYLNDISFSDNTLL